MKIDNKDLQILEMIYNGEPGDEFTTSYIAKEVFNPDSNDELSNLDAKVNHRLKKMSDYGIVEVENGGGPATYRLRKEKIIFGEGSLQVETDLDTETESYSFDTGGILFVKEDDGFQVFSYVGIPDEAE